MRFSLFNKKTDRLPVGAFHSVQQEERLLVGAFQSVQQED